MTFDETKAAASRLHKATMTTLRRCRGSNPNKSGEALAHCATPQLIDVVLNNDTLIHALALQYALMVVADLPPVAAKPKVEPRAEWSVNLLVPSEGK